ncbi:hypothetical protein MTR_8g047250 [Medicago truncatula]|uniref:Uncharacterized protein n=1 Tax=Medicago truncatula TaxID=3880 RepID=A0A072U0U3_MEDTR|nr:hypothetical protein MTR_8g047250 [Medicago truncatula]
MNSFLGAAKYIPTKPEFTHYDVLNNYGDVDEGRFLFDCMPEKNVLSCNVMMSRYSQNRRVQDAFTARNIGFSYKIFRRNFLESSFLQISDEIFVGKHLSVKWQLVIGCLYRGILS